MVFSTCPDFVYLINNVQSAYDILQSSPILGEGVHQMQSMVVLCSLLPVGITAEYARPLRKAAYQVKPRYPVLVKNIPRGTCWQVNELRLSASWPELTFITRHLGT